MLQKDNVWNFKTISEEDGSYSDWVETLRSYIETQLNERTGKKWQVTTRLCLWDFEFICRLGDFRWQTNNRNAKDFTTRRMDGTPEDVLDLDVDIAIASLRWKEERGD